MSHEADKDEIARLEKRNAEMKGSLERCHELLREARERLAAKPNETLPADDDDQSGSKSA